MKQITETELEKAYKLPANFPIEEFDKNVVVTINTLMSYSTQQEWADLRFQFMSTVLQSLGSSSYFKQLKPKERAHAMRQWLDLQYILDILIELFTDDVIDNNTALWLHLQSKLIAAKSK